MNYVSSNVFGLSTIALELCSIFYFYFTNDLYLVRPKASDVFCHPFFGDLEKKVELVCDLCYHFPDNDDLKGLESKAPILRDPKWLSKFLDYASNYYGCPKQLVEDFKV